MKRLFIINNHFGAAAQYGIKTFIEQLLYILDGAHLRITIVELCCSPSEKIHSEIKNGIERLYVPMISPFTKENNDIYCRNVAYILLSRINAEDECTFHFNFLHHKVLAETLRRIYPQGKQILTIHYFEWLFEVQGDVKLFSRIIHMEKSNRSLQEMEIYEMYKCDKAFFQTVDHVVALCHTTYDILCTIYQISPSKLCLIPNGMKDEFYAISREERNITRLKLGFAPTDKLILFVGRITLMKGIGILIESMKRIIDEDPSVHLLLVGKGEEDTFRGMCMGYWKNIHFIGQVNRETVTQLYRVADLGVLPSLHEQCSCVAIEMMMFDLPFVASCCGALKDIPANEGLQEYMIEKKDVNTLLCKIRQYISQQHINDNNFRKYFLKYFREDNLKAYMQLY